MEPFYKRYFWTAWLVFIALASLLATRIGNTFVAAALEPAPVVAVPTTPRMLHAAATGPASVGIDPFGHLFGIEPPPPPPPDEALEAQKAASRICFTCPPVKTGMRLQLMATVIANEKRWSLALISDLDKQSTDLYSVGDTIRSATIRDMERDTEHAPGKVIIVNEETRRLEYIDATPGTGVAVNTAGLGNLGVEPVPGAGEPPTEGANMEGIRQVGPDIYTVERSTLDKALANLNEVATQARIVPSFKNGVANGFKLFSIRPGSLYSSIGVQNGDVITRINGFDMNSPDKALEIYTRLKDAQNLEIEIERRGQIVKKTYTIK